LDFNFYLLLYSAILNQLTLVSLFSAVSCTAPFGTFHGGHWSTFYGAGNPHFLDSSDAPSNSYALENASSNVPEIHHFFTHAFPIWHY
jgi:hypothetical protein